MPRRITSGGFDIIDPDDVWLGCHGGGTSLADAVAVAWINTCIRAWWWQPYLSEEDCQSAALGARWLAVRVVRGAGAPCAEGHRRLKRPPWSPIGPRGCERDPGQIETDPGLGHAGMGYVSGHWRHWIFRSWLAFLSRSWDTSPPSRSDVRIANPMLGPE